MAYQEDTCKVCSHLVCQVLHFHRILQQWFFSSQYQDLWLISSNVFILFSTYSMLISTWGTHLTIFSSSVMLTWATFSGDRVTCLCMSITVTLDTCASVESIVDTCVTIITSLTGKPSITYIWSEVFKHKYIFVGKKVSLKFSIFYSPVGHWHFSTALVLVWESDPKAPTSIAAVCRVPSSWSLWYLARNISLSMFPDLKLYYIIFNVI